jgi:large subunit ribosomal protein L19
MSSPAQIVQKIERLQLRQTALPDFRSGDTVRVQVKIREGEKERLQAFEGVVTARAKAKSATRASFTVRKISYGVGVERTFPENSPNVSSVEILSRGRVRQGRLYYLRDLSGKAARITERKVDRVKVDEAARLATETAAAAGDEAAIAQLANKPKTKTQARKDEKAKKAAAKAERTPVASAKKSAKKPATKK